MTVAVTVAAAPAVEKAVTEATLVVLVMVTVAVVVVVPCWRWSSFQHKFCTYRKDSLTSFPQVANTEQDIGQPIALEQQSRLLSTRLPWQ